MADTKITDLANLPATSLAAPDLIVVVDKSDTSMAASGTNVNVRFDDLSGLWIPKSAVTAAGDVLVGAGSGTVTNLPIGTVAGKTQAADPGATNKISVQYPMGLDQALRGTAGSFASTFDRRVGPDLARTMTSGRIECSMIILPKGATVTSIGFWCVTTSASAPTHQWFGLFDSSFNQLGVTSDDTTTAWTANNLKKLNLASPFVTTYTGVHYVGVLVTATTTMPGIQSYSASLDTTVMRNTAPPCCFAGNTGLTTPGTCPSTLSNGGVIGNLHYAEVF